MAAGRGEPGEASPEGSASSSGARPSAEARASWGDRLARTVGPRVSLGLALLSGVLVVAALPRRSAPPATGAEREPGRGGGPAASAARRRLAEVRGGLADLNVSHNATSERRLFGFGIARVNDRFVEMPTCIINVEQAGLKLMQAGASVRTAVNVCRRTDTQERRMLCASVIADIIAFVGFGAEFLEGSGQQCADHLVAGDLCAETVTELVAGLAQVVQASTGIKAVCMNLTRHELLQRHQKLLGTREDPVMLLAGEGRRLEEFPYIQEDYAEQRALDGLAGRAADRMAGRAADLAGRAADRIHREQHREAVGSALRGAAGKAAKDVKRARIAKRGIEAAQERIEQRREKKRIAEELEQVAAQAALNNSIRDQRLFNHFKCFLHASEAAEFVARAGDIISASVLDCAPVNKNGPEGEQACELDVVGIIESFTMAANSIARTVFRCPTIVNICAACAANIINVIAATEALVNAVSGLSLCIKQPHDAFVEHETHLLPPAVYLPAPPEPADGGPAPPQRKAVAQANAPGGYGGFGGYYGGYRRDPGVLPPPQWQQPPRGQQQQQQRPVEQSQASAPDNGGGGAGGGAYAEPQAGEYYGPEP